MDKLLDPVSGMPVLFSHLTAYNLNAWLKKWEEINYARPRAYSNFDVAENRKPPSETEKQKVNKARNSFKAGVPTHAHAGSTGKFKPIQRVHSLDYLYEGSFRMRPFIDERELARKAKDAK